MQSVSVQIKRCLEHFRQGALKAGLLERQGGVGRLEGLESLDLLMVGVTMRASSP